MEMYRIIEPIIELCHVMNGMAITTNIVLSTNKTLQLSLHWSLN